VSDYSFRDDTTGAVNTIRRPRVRVSLFAAFVFLAAHVPASSQPRPSAASSASKSDWVLTWSDEFNGADGSAPDPAKWDIQSGGSGWGNGELQYYTPRRQNVRLEDGNLVIQAVREKFIGADGIESSYTSGRIQTRGKFSQKYGRFEARIKVPYGQGIWPAFWLLGDDFSTDGWPVCGEIDIMENVGSESSTIHSTLHGLGYSGANALTSSFTFPKGRLSDDFHVFAVEWEPQAIHFYADDHLYATRTPADLPSGKRWAFDHPFFVILDLAVGGSFPSNPDASTIFPQKMVVDYVRVYSRQ
jgi:beta-glucanase (GH16 family)